MGKFSEDQEVKYTLKDPSNGLFIQQVEGDSEVGEFKLGKRDALGVWDTTEVTLKIKAGSTILLMEVPMQ